MGKYLDKLLKIYLQEINMKIYTVKNLIDFSQLGMYQFVKVGMSDIEHIDVLYKLLCTGDVLLSCHWLYFTFCHTSFLLYSNL